MTIPLLAQGAGATRSVLILSIGLIFLVLLLFLLVVWLRKRLSPVKESSPIGFSLADLRSLRQKGAISPEEFERAKARIVQGLRPSDGPADKPGKMHRERPSAPSESSEDS